MEATRDIHAEEAAAPLPLPPEQWEPWGSFLRTMAWIGLNTFGGPVAQLGVMQHEAVEKRRWLTDGQFIRLINFANLLPGPEALEVCIHLGYLRRGIRGGIVAGLLFIWPGFVTLTALAWVYMRYGQVQAVTGFLDGVRPVAMALVAVAAVRLSGKSLKGSLSYVLMSVAFLASYVFDVPFVAILIGSALLGLMLARASKHENGSKVPGWVFAAIVVLLIGATQIGSRNSPSTRTDPGKLVPRQATQPEPTIARLAEVAWVNTKAALLTFGGAYTVLPYLREQTVDRYAWLTNEQMADALALGETTPGPLISIGVFLSYLAAGLPGAIVSCVFLFLPSFVFVLALGRNLRKIEGWPQAQAILWGVSAGTLGLIVALAADLVPASLPDIFSALVALAAFAAIWRFKSNLIVTVLVGGLLGLARAQVLGGS